MTDQDVLIQLDDEVEGHGWLRLSPDDEDWARDRLGRNGPARVTLRVADEDDTEGHAIGTTVMLRVFDDDDTEGHAITTTFPSAEAAASFRRRLMLAGVLTGSIVLGGVAGAGLSNLVSDDGGGATNAATSTVQGADDGGDVIPGGPSISGPQPR